MFLRLSFIPASTSKKHSGRGPIYTPPNSSTLHLVPPPSVVATKSWLRTMVFPPIVLRMMAHHPISNNTGADEALLLPAGLATAIIGAIACLLSLSPSLFCLLLHRPARSLYSLSLSLFWFIVASALSLSLSLLSLSLSLSLIWLSLCCLMSALLLSLSPLHLSRRNPLFSILPIEMVHGRQSCSLDDIAVIIDLIGERGVTIPLQSQYIEILGRY